MIYEYAYVENIIFVFAVTITCLREYFLHNNNNNNTFNVSINVSEIWMAFSKLHISLIHHHNHKHS